jgi:hypothetical protein
MKCGFLILILLIWSCNAVAQSTQQCSQISIESVAKVDPGTPVVFTARVGHISPNEDQKYRWQVSVGTIMTGQATHRIAVDTTGLGGQLMEAIVEVIGRDWSCSIKSKPVEIAPQPIPCGLAFDQYGDIKWEDEKARLDNFAIQLMNQPSARGAIITFAGNPTYKGEAALKLRRAKNYVVNFRKIASERVITSDAGYRTDLITYMYIVPAGATVPVLDSESLPLSKVRFTKPKPTLKRKPRFRA